MQNNAITSQQLEDIKASIKYTDLYYVDYSDELSNEHIQEVIDTGYLDSVDFYDLYDTYETTENIKENIQNEFDFSDDFMEQNEQEILDAIYETCSNDPVPQLLNHSSGTNGTLIMHSAWEGVRSGWVNSQGGYVYNEGLRQIVDILNLDPASFKKALEDAGYETIGEFPSKTERIDNEFVKYSDFVEELENTTSECNFLTFLVKIDPIDFYGEKKSIVKIPAGNLVGLFDYTQGGGSVFGCELLRDFTVDLSKNHGDSVYDKWSLAVDGQGDGYSIDSVYGMTSQAFGDTIEVL